MLFARLFAARFGLVLALAAAGCADLEGEALEETSSELSVSSWVNVPAPGVNAIYGPQDPQVATLNGTTYVLFRLDKDLYWKRRTATGWTDRELIAAELTQDPVKLAAFNGFLYMVYAPHADRSQVWLSRFDPATETWRSPIRLSYVGFNGPPALAAFDGKLFFVGSLKRTLFTTTYPMWVGTMNAAETFTASQLISTSHESANPPSLAVYAGKLFAAHRHGAGANIAISTHSPGAAPASWTSPVTIPADSLGAPIRGFAPSIAAVNGFLHLVHTRFSPETPYVWWTYFDTCRWAPEITIHNMITDHRPSLTAGGAGLLLLTTFENEVNNTLYMRATEFHAPPPPITPPPGCGVVGP